MSGGAEIDLGLGLLDRQLVDCRGRRCGNVDDLELDLATGEAPLVTAILAGPAAWAPRLPGALGRLGARLARRPAARVAWDEVEAVASAVQLRQTASELGLGRGDDRAARLVERLPRS